MFCYVHGNGLHDGGFHVLLMPGHGHITLVRDHLTQACAWHVDHYVGGA